MERDAATSQRGQWKKRIGFGRKTKAMVILKADGTGNNRGGASTTTSTVMIPPDDGDARALRRQTKKSNNNFFRASFRNKSAGSTPSHHMVDTESRDDGPHRPPRHMTKEGEFEEKKFDEPGHPRKGDAYSTMSPTFIPHYDVKQQMKERDGFCRRVSEYDGNLIKIDGLPNYEIANYLGGGVAGVVYQGHRLRPLSEYPIRRLGINDLDEETQQKNHQDNGIKAMSDEPAGNDAVGMFCAPLNFDPDHCTGCGDQDTMAANANGGEELDTVLSPESGDTIGSSTSDIDTFTRAHETNTTTPKGTFLESTDMAIEATVHQGRAPLVLLDGQDTPSRSQHFSYAAGVPVTNRSSSFATSQQQHKDLAHGLTDEAVAVKILNPVAYRLLTPEALKEAVIVKRGEPMDMDMRLGKKPMNEKNVWWLVNPNSRNLRTLQRYNEKDKVSNSSAGGGVQIDRGSKENGLRLSLIAAYLDPRTNSTQLKELPLDRCIEIWGHVPFNATDLEFEDFLVAIERVNAGHSPRSLAWKSLFAEQKGPKLGRELTDISFGDESASENLSSTSAQTGLVRAALSKRETVYCQELNAYIAVSAVPTKYIRWLRQRRAATKEVRNMMLIGRHRNVLHLFEVLEFIQESKSTMFLILELVKGGELFDLISSNAGKNKKRPEDIKKVEQMMRKFFFELASGINYCHKNGIAHRDLKPENLLVHNGADGEATLKIADFGLSASFSPNTTGYGQDHDDISDREPTGVGSPVSQTSSNAFSPKHRSGDAAASPTSQGSSSSAVKESMDKFIMSGATALSFLTCGAMETILCYPNGNGIMDGPSTMRRMTSVVGSPHYVAPEIISQHEEGKRASPKGNRKGYDGAKADVWSCGVILYAMLFRSLPFGEDLLRCPRYQSYRKWYDEIRQLGGRRSSAVAALSGTISAAEEREFLGPQWFFPAATSKESRDLIVAMLNPNPEGRLSVPQVLDHPWMKMIAKEC